MNKLGKVDYGNWVSKKFIYLPLLISVVFFGLAFFFRFFLIGTFVFLIPAAYFIYAYRQFSSRGGNLQAKIRDLVFTRLPWNGNGKLLDIGCGNGALAIQAAQKYSGSVVSGIDYWGGQWEYSKQVCEQNARVTGVDGSTSFQKASASKLPFPDNSFDAVVSNLVFHEVQDTDDKRAAIKEAFRVLKKGGSFAFQDLFLLKKLYGEPEDLIATVKGWGINDVRFVKTNGEKFIPRAMKLPFMVGQIGILYGVK
jgi:SAM-dependent methyltransferase